MRNILDWLNVFNNAVNSMGFDPRDPRQHWEYDLGSIDLIIAGGVVLFAGIAAYLLHRHTLATPSLSLSEEDNEYECRLRAAGINPDLLDYPLEYLDPISKRIMVKPVSLVFANNELSVDSYEYPEKGISQFLGGLCPISRRAIEGFRLNDVLQENIYKWVNATIADKLRLSITTVSLFQAEGHLPTTTGRLAPTASL